jgi:hypothetical protein
MDWIYLAQDMDRWWTLVNTVVNLQGISQLVECTISFSRRTLLHGIVYAAALDPCYTADTIIFPKMKIR